MGTGVCADGALRSLAVPVGTATSIQNPVAAANIAPTFFPNHQQVLMTWVSPGSSTESYVAFNASVPLFGDDTWTGVAVVENVTTNDQRLNASIIAGGGGSMCMAYSPCVLLRCA
jgi:hypothetical protein